jgi:threonine/homoserine/homoserine lactone efflux protein
MWLNKDINISHYVDMCNLPLRQAILFLVASASLLGSPGPGIAALLAIGRREGFKGGMRFYGGMQFGLALASGLSAVGIRSVLTALPWVTTVLTVIAIFYLLFLGWQIATAPVTGMTSRVHSVGSTPVAGFFFGVANPKAYLAFASLMAFPPIIDKAGSQPDLSLKWGLCVLVMIVVDAIWLWFGVVTRVWNLNHRRERLVNVGMGFLVVLAAIVSSCGLSIN